MSAALEADIAASDAAQSLRDAIDALNAEIEAAEEAGDGAKADALKRKKRCAAAAGRQRLFRLRAADCERRFAAGGFVVWRQQRPAVSTSPRDPV